MSTEAVQGLVGANIPLFAGFCSSTLYGNTYLFKGGGGGCRQIYCQDVSSITVCLWPAWRTAATVEADLLPREEPPRSDNAEWSWGRGRHLTWPPTGHRAARGDHRVVVRSPSIPASSSSSEAGRAGRPPGTRGASRGRSLRTDNVDGDRWPRGSGGLVHRRGCNAG